MITEEFFSHYNPQPNPVIQAALKSVEETGERRDNEYLLERKKEDTTAKPTPVTAKGSSVAKSKSV